MILDLNFIVLIVFITSLLGIVVNRANILLILISLELCLLSINVNLLTSSVTLDDLIGQLFAVFVLTIAAAETSIGLAVLIIYHRIQGSIMLDYLSQLKS